jgi:hypothetical protein
MGKGKDIELAELKRVPTVTLQQETSSFFKLPFEIRQKIYEDVLGGYVIHIHFVQAYRRMSHTRCKSSTPAICDGKECRERFKVPGVPDEWGNVSLLALLLTCRRM